MTRLALALRIVLTVGFFCAPLWLIYISPWMEVSPVIIVGIDALVAVACGIVIQMIWEE